MVKPPDDAGAADGRGTAGADVACGTADAAGWPDTAERPTEPNGPPAAGEAGDLGALGPVAGEAGVWLASEARRFPACVLPRPGNAAVAAPALSGSEMGAPPGCKRAAHLGLAGGHDWAGAALLADWLLAGWLRAGWVLTDWLLAGWLTAIDLLPTDAPFGALTASRPA